MSASPAPAGARRALVIASQTGALTGCHNDAELVADLLAERGFDVNQLREARATRTGILGAYEDLIRVTKQGDSVVVFYAGHGSRSTTSTPGTPGELRFILPTDVARTDADDFRGILAEELSALQWRLTLRTPDVTTLLDCCFSARMAREAVHDRMRVRGWEATWPKAAVARRWAVAGAEFRRLRDEHPQADWFDANPHAVRLVACGSHQRAHEDYSFDFGGSHGLFTAALIAALRAAPHTTWQSVMDRVRHQVLAMNPLQRPEAEGPVDRIPFTLDVRRTEQPHPVRTDPGTGQAWLDGARLHGIRPGDQFLLSRAGLAPDASIAPVVRVTHLITDAALLDSADGRPVPDGSMAHPWRSAGRDLDVRVTAVEGASTEPVVAGLAGLPGIGVRSDAAEHPTDIATVALADSTYMLYDTTGLPLYRTRRALDPGGLAELRGHVRDLAASLRLRSLGDGVDELPAPVDFSVSAESGCVTDGAVLHLTDRLWVSVAHAGTGGETVHANVLDVGVAGRITVLNQAEPAGITLDPAERRALGEEPGGHAPGMPFLWPAGVPVESARYETLIAVFSDSPQDLRGLTRAGVGVRGGSPVSEALARLVRTGTREIGGRLGSVRYAIRRVTFLLCPCGPACSRTAEHQRASSSDAARSRGQNLSASPATVPHMTNTKRSVTGTAPLLGTRALNRATLDRQLLLRPARLSVAAAVEHLLGLQAQNVKPPYYALAARLDGFTPEALSRLMADREAVRIVTMRSTIHTHTADDCLTLRPLVQPARDRELVTFRKGLAGVDLDRLTGLARDLVEAEPRTMGQLREALLREWPDADPQALAVAARCRLPLVQVTPRGLWGQSGQVRLTTAEHWLGRPTRPAATPDSAVLRYLAAFGPASVRDMQAWAGMTRLRDAFERLRPQLVTFRDETGVELFDLPGAPRPDPETPAPPRFLPEFDNLLLSHADRTRVVPPEHRGRSWQGNLAHRTLLVDGFLAGLWRLEEDALVIEPFERLTRTRQDEVTAEGERMLRVMHPGSSYDIRFGVVRA